MTGDEDLAFLASNYLYGDLPPEKDFLKHYFKGEAEKSFISYYFIFSHLYSKGKFSTFYDNFCDHTGISCSTRWIRKLLVRVRMIEEELEKASKDFDLEKVAKIKSGEASF